MDLTVTGGNSDVFHDAFFNSFGDIDLDFISTSSSGMTLRNAETGFVTTITGSGFSYTSDDVASGTINSLVISQGGSTLASMTGMSWSAVAFSNALGELETNDNAVPFANLFNSSGSVNINLSGASTGINLDDLLGIDMLDAITVSTTITGSNFYDQLFSTGGNDSVSFGNGGFEYYSSAGNDTINFGSADSDADPWIDHYRIGPITMNVNGSTNTASVTGSGSSDTWLNVNNVLGYSLSTAGSDQDDTINVTLANGQWMSFRPKEGDDTINATLDGGTLRLEYHRVSGQDATNGIVANIGAGFVTDSEGFTDTVNITEINRGRLEIRATDNADNITGFDGRDSFIGRGGNDTMDGAGGFDKVRFDRSGYSGSVDLDFEAGTASGTYDGNAFTYTLSNIEMAQSGNGDDTLRGSDGADEWFTGNGGDDVIDGRGGTQDGVYTHVNQADATLTALADGSGLILSSSYGNDTLTSIEILEFMDGEVAVADLFGGVEQSGGGGNNTLQGSLGDDTIAGLNGNDTLRGGMGDDLVKGGKDEDILYGDAGNDIMRGQRHADVLYGGDDDDNVKGGGGNDTLYGDGGNDFLKGGSRVDVVYGGEGDDKLAGNSFDDTLDGGAGDDRLIAGGDNDVLIGGIGNDVLKGGSGADTFVFDTGHGIDDILDFDVAEDVLQISTALASGESAASIAADATVVSNGVLIDFGTSEIVLRGLTTTTGLVDAIDIL